MRPNFVHKKRFNFFYDWWRESGVKEKYKTWVLYSQLVGLYRNFYTEDLDGLVTLANCSALFFIYQAVMFASMVVFMLEVLVSKYWKSN